MLVYDKKNIIEAAKVTGRKFVLFFLLALVVAFVSTYTHVYQYLLPKTIISIFAAPVGIFLAFRINSGYGRWWWARKVWGELIVNSRSLALYLSAFLREAKHATTEDRELQRQLIYGHIGFINALRLQLRKQGEDDWEHEIWQRKINEYPLFTDDEIEVLRSTTNKATNIIRLQGDKVASYFVSDKEEYKYVKIIELMREIYFSQGQSELIKNTVFPWGYSFYTRGLVWMLALLLPFSQVNSAEIHHILLVAIISTAFVTIEQVGRNLDNPFDGTFNDTPITAICRVIEIDMLQATGEPCDLKLPVAVDGRLD